MTVLGLHKRAHKQKHETPCKGSTLESNTCSAKSIEVSGQPRQKSLATTHAKSEHQIFKYRWLLYKTSFEIMAQDTLAARFPIESVSAS